MSTIANVPAVRRLLIVLVATLFCSGFGPGPATADEAELWEALRTGGHVALLRHALAPGGGDPANFEIGDCTTQRNLSKEGRDQSERIGERFRANGIEAARVFSSQWCRCLDTAQLLGLGPVSELPALNSLFRRPEKKEPQMRALKDWLGKRDLSQVHVLVTHQFTIAALTGAYPASGELVIVRVTGAGAGDVTVTGTIATQ